MWYLCFSGRSPWEGTAVFFWEGRRSAETAAQRLREQRTVGDMPRGSNCKLGSGRSEDESRLCDHNLTIRQHVGCSHMFGSGLPLGAHVFWERGRPARFITDAGGTPALPSDNRTVQGKRMRDNDTIGDREPFSSSIPVGRYLSGGRHGLLDLLRHLPLVTCQRRLVVGSFRSWTNSRKFFRCRRRSTGGSA